MDKGEQAGKGQGKGHQQQMDALGKQFRHEEQKHMQFKARLERIRELAAKKGDAKVLDRVNTLIEKEQSRYSRKVERIRQRSKEIIWKPLRTKGSRRNEKKRQGQR